MPHSTGSILTENNTTRKLSAIEKAKEIARKRRKAISNKKHAEKNVKYRKEYGKKWREKNVEHNKERKKKWNRENTEHLREYQEQWRAENPEYHREHSRKWKKENPDKNNVKNAKYYASKFNRTPPWYEYDRVRAVYRLAALKRKNGKDVHVDHIVPLKGKLVSGLHCFANLQIIPADENLLKNNKFEVAA